MFVGIPCKRWNNIGGDWHPGLGGSWGCRFFVQLLGAMTRCLIFSTSKYPTSKNPRKVGKKLKVFAQLVSRFVCFMTATPYLNHLVDPRGREKWWIPLTNSDLFRVIVYRLLHHGKSPLNQHSGEYVWLFPSILNKSKEMDIGHLKLGFLKGKAISKWKHIVMFQVLNIPDNDSFSFIHLVFFVLPSLLYAFLQSWVGSGLEGVYIAMYLANGWSFGEWWRKHEKHNKSWIPTLDGSSPNKNVALQLYLPWHWASRCSK